ncbi:hypothetical protein CC80DRAFT_403528 [Byssothecium circinans]|uniref:Transcription factor domain-containing protein n=1 Tax=Byssothecium circinans TaxID=147558 RepID=A0A6A5U6E0_9PLEO|nr:hypothetical protein CC80DRAFT_403528 [Byssothecium circinans]
MLGIHDPNLSFSNFGLEPFDWPANDVDLTNLLDSQPELPPPLEQPIISASSDLVRTTSLSEDRIIQRPPASYENSLPQSPKFLIRSLIPKASVQRGASRSVTLILHTLQSYPRAMMRHDALPPFIHPEFISPGVGEKSVEPLANCISLVHMISSRVRGSRKLFWKNVRLECEHILAELLNLDKWQLLTAMQALSIYTITRLDEGETDDNNVDFLLLSTIAAIVQQIMCVDAQCNTPSAHCSYNGKPSWQDWIYEESRRRLSIVLRVVGMLVYFEPTLMCNLQTDLLLAPLPSRKQLWEADNEFKWQHESKSDDDLMSTFGLAASGDLLKLNTSHTFCADAVLYYKDPNEVAGREKSVVNWEEWCAGMDGFGALVMLAASLVG